MEEDHIETRIRRNWKERIRHFYRRDNVKIYYLAGIGCGLIVGVAIKIYDPLSSNQKENINFPMEKSISVLMCMSVCYLVLGIIAGICGLGRAVSRRVALQTLIYVMITGVLSMTEGLIVAVVFKPGAINVTRETDEMETFFTPLDAVLDFIRNVVPRSFLAAFVRKYITYRFILPSNPAENSSLESNEPEEIVMGMYIEGPNLVGLIFGSFLIGYCMTIVGTHGKTLADTVLTLYEALKVLSNFSEVTQPIGLFFVAMTIIQETESWEFYFSQRKFIYTVLIGLLFHTFIVLPFIFWLVTNCNFFSILSRSYSPVIGGLFLSSSLATMPITAKVCEERLKINRSLTRVMLPILTTINMNGTVIYEVIALVFIAQLNHIPQTMTNLLSYGLVPAFISLGTPGIPASGALNTIFACAIIGLPMMDMPWLILLEPILDRFRTVVNIIGDLMCVSLLHKISRMDLEELEEETLETVHLETLDPELIMTVD